MWDIVFIISMWLYWFSEGCTEGYTFAKPKRRKENKLICGRVGEGLAKVDYHTWRLGENLGTIGLLVGAYFSTAAILNFGLFLVGSWLTGTWIYERALNYVFSNDLFPQKEPYHLLGLTIPRNQIVEGIITAGLGAALLIAGVMV